MALTDTIVADGNGTQWQAAAWDGLWAKKPSPVHNKVTEPPLSKGHALGVLWYLSPPRFPGLFFAVFRFSTVALGWFREDCHMMGSSSFFSSLLMWLGFTILR